MARLRKLGGNEPERFAPPSDTKATRASPRKTTRTLRYADSSEDENRVLVPKASKRDLRYAPDGDDSFAVPKLPASEALANTPRTTLTPRKQRVLRPVQSNSRLMRKLSHESLASPEKRQRERRDRSGIMDTDVDKRGRLMYAKSLAKSVVKKQAKAAGKIDVVDSVDVDDGTQIETSIKTEDVERDAKSEEDEVQIKVEEVEEMDTSMWCGEDSHVKREEEEEQVGNISSDEDEDPVVDTRAKRRQPRSRYVVSESESDGSELSEDERDDYIQTAHSQSPQRFVAFSSKQPRFTTASQSPSRKDHSMISEQDQEMTNLSNSSGSFETFELPKQTRVRTASLLSSRPHSSASNAANAILTYSPTPIKFRSPCKAPPISRPSTPPLLPPSPCKLVSPSKKRPTIPKAEHIDGRPSLDAFWNPEAVNEWNDAHLPSKPPVSPRKQKWRDDIVKMMEGIGLDDASDSDSAFVTPPTSPQKKNNPSPTKNKSPSKKKTPEETAEQQAIKALRAQRKDFAARKHLLAESFLAELDSILCNGAISSASASTGGIKLVWSKTLKTTAGRATWRREQFRLRDASLSPPYNTTLATRHHCAIELAEKVIDDESRLYNVLAHEFCHLATFIVSGVRNNPHGKEFKAWGAKASGAFKDKDVVVTTKHAYEIEYKFVWECVGCGMQFKRHSRSVDTTKHSCGKCRGRLVQTRPVPRGMGRVGGEGGGVTGRDGRGNGEAEDMLDGRQASSDLVGAHSQTAPPPKPKQQSEYQLFVKHNFARIKNELLANGENAQMGRVMELVGKEYRVRKGKTETLKKEEKEKKREVVVLSDDEEEDGAGGGSSDEVDDMLGALDGLKI